MKTRGRPSAASLETQTAVQEVHRADAPYDLPQEQSDVWRATLEALPAGWVGAEGHPILAAFCRTTVQLRRVGQLIHHEETAPGPLDLAEYSGLLKLHAQLAQSLKTLATSLRLTPQSRMRAENAATKAGNFTPGPRPWEY
jgi:phage terminase small subunit